MTMIAALARQARVLRGGERVLEQDLDVAAAERRAVGDVVGHPARVARGARDDEPRRDVGAAVQRAEAGGGVHAGRVLRRDRRAAAPAAEGAAAQVLQRAARDPQQEEVEHGEEAELQADGDRFEHVGLSLVVRGERWPLAGERTPDGLLDLEADVGGAERDAVAGLQRLGAADPVAVDVHAVRRAEVGDRPRARGRRAGSRRGGARRWRRRARRRTRGCGRSPRRWAATTWRLPSASSSARVGARAPCTCSTSSRMRPEVE